MPPFNAYMSHDDSLHAGLATFLSSLGTVRVRVHLSVKYRWKKSYVRIITLKLLIVLLSVLEKGAN